MQEIAISVQINYPCHFCDSLYISGGIDELGNWDPQKALRLEWTAGDFWVGEFKLPKKLHKFIEYKFLVNTTDLCYPCQNMHWEHTEDRCLILKGKSSIQLEESWGYKHLTNMVKLTEDLIERKLEEISKESIKIEKTLENRDQQQLAKTLIIYEQKNPMEIFVQDEQGWCSDFHQIIPLLLYLYHTKVTASQLLVSIQASSDYMREFIDILKNLVKKLKQILCVLIETLKSSETCVNSIETEFSRILKLKNSSSRYNENFTNNVFVAYMNDAVNSLTSLLKRDNFGLVEDKLKAKIIEVTSGVLSIKDSMKNLEALIKEKNKVEREMLEDKGKYNKLQLSLELIFLCKNYYLSIQNNQTNEIKEHEDHLKSLVNEILGKNKWNASNFYYIMGKINSTLFEKYRKIVTHESCQQDFQNIVTPNDFNRSYDINDYNTLYSIIDQSYSEMIEAAQTHTVYMKFRNDADRALLILFLNYMLLHYAIRIKIPNFPYFNASGCSEMNPFCQEENTDLSLANFTLLRKKLANNFVSKQKLTEKWQGLTAEICNMEKFLIDQCKKYGAENFSSLMEIVMNLQKIRLAIFGDDQISLFSKLLEINSEIIKDSANIVDSQEEIDIKYELTYLLMKGKEVRNFKYLLGEMKDTFS